MMKLDNAKEELKWWIENFSAENGKAISILLPDIIISSDAAKGNMGGWEAHCSQSSTGGYGQSQRKENTSIS